MAPHLAQIKGSVGGDDKEEYGPTSSSISDSGSLSLREGVNHILLIATESATEPQVQWIREEDKA